MRTEWDVFCAFSTSFSEVGASPTSLHSEPAGDIALFPGRTSPQEPHIRGRLSTQHPYLCELISASSCPFIPARLLLPEGPQFTELFLVSCHPQHHSPLEESNIPERETDVPTEGRARLLGVVRTPRGQQLHRAEGDQYQRGLSFIL